MARLSPNTRHPTHSHLTPRQHRLLPSRLRPNEITTTKKLTQGRNKTAISCAKEQWDTLEFTFDLIDSETTVYLMPAADNNLEFGNLKATIDKVYVGRCPRETPNGVVMLFKRHAKPTGQYVNMCPEDAAGKYDIIIRDTAG